MAGGVLVALALAVPSAWRWWLYRNLTSEIEELLPAKRQRRRGGRAAPAPARAVDAGRGGGDVDPSELPAAERLIDDLAARVRGYPPELVRAVKTGEEAAAERRFLAAHLPLFVDVGDLVEVRKPGRGAPELGHAQPPGHRVRRGEAAAARFLRHRGEVPGALPRACGCRRSAERRGDAPERTRYSDERGTATLLLIEGSESSLGAHQAPPAPRARQGRTSRRWAGRRDYAPGLRVGFAGNIAVSVEELWALSADLGKVVRPGRDRRAAGDPAVFPLVGGAAAAVHAAGAWRR